MVFHNESLAQERLLSKVFVVVGLAIFLPIWNSLHRIMAFCCLRRQYNTHLAWIYLPLRM